MKSRKITSLNPYVTSINQKYVTAKDYNFLWDDVNDNITDDGTFNGIVFTADGDVSTPAIAFEGDLDTGIYSPIANNISIATAGSQRLNIDASGNATLNSPGVMIVKGSSGTVPVGGYVVATEYGDGKNHVTSLAITALPITIGDNENLGIGVLIYTLPTGPQMITASYMSVGLTATDAANAANTPEVGLGQTIASTAVAVLSTAGWEDIFEGDAMANCTGTAYTLAKLPTATVLTQAGGTKTIYLNFAAAWSNNTVQTATITGTVVLKWTQLS